MATQVHGILAGASSAPRVRGAVALATYLERCGGALRIESLEHARTIYVEYHALLCESGRYSVPVLLASLARSLVMPSLSAHESTDAIHDLGLFDSPGVNGLRTLQEAGIGTLLDMRLPRVLLTERRAKRVRSLLSFTRSIANPRVFFGVLFDRHVDATMRVLHARPASVVHAANERSIAAAPALAAAKFLAGRRAVIIQHGNPIGDYLPTLADRYVCRSARWHAFLTERRIVGEVARGADFPPLAFMRHAPQSRRVVLLLHNVGYLEPAVDYRELTAGIAIACRAADYALSVLPHPMRRETYGLPVAVRTQTIDAALAIGYRSTVMDQLPADMPRISLLDYWPDFFLREGRPEQLADFTARVRDELR
jgi:hypothetical protein